MKKLYILDTNVLLSDPLAIHRFAEHSIHIPFIVLEELDKAKHGHTELARNAREATRQLESCMVIELTNNSYRINDKGGTLFFTTKELKDSIPSDKSNDNIIINETMALMELYPNVSITLVSKDINIRVKAKSLNIDAEDYKHDKAINDDDILSLGYSIFKIDKFTTNTADRLIQHFNKGSLDIIKIDAPLFLKDNMVFMIEDTNCVYLVRDCFDDYCELQPLKNYTGKNSCFGIRAKNTEQNIAFNMLLEPNNTLVALLGDAGCGKTMLSLASSLELVLEEKKYDKIIYIRDAMPAAGAVEIGFTTGDKNDKLALYMGPLYDNLTQLIKFESKQHKDTGLDMVMDKIEIESPLFLRGRSFTNSIIIVDEAQSMTLMMLKMILSRAGENCKVILMGNLAQIDSAFLSASTSGLTHVVKKMAKWDKFSHIILQETVRSELTQAVNDFLD